MPPRSRPRRCWSRPISFPERGRHVPDPDSEGRVSAELRLEPCGAGHGLMSVADCGLGGQQLVLLRVEGDARRQPWGGGNRDPGPRAGRERREIEGIRVGPWSPDICFGVGLRQVGERNDRALEASLTPLSCGREVTGDGWRDLIGFQRQIESYCIDGGLPFQDAGNGSVAQGVGFHGRAPTAPIVNTLEILIAILYSVI